MLLIGLVGTVVAFLREFGVLVTAILLPGRTASAWGIGMHQVSGGIADIGRLLRDLSELALQLEDAPARSLLGGGQPEEYLSR